MTDPNTQLENVRDRIGESGEISDADRAALTDFDERLTLLNSEYSPYTHLKYLRRATIMAEETGGIAASLDDRDTAEELVTWIHRNYEGEEANQGYRIALRVFGSRVSDENGDDPPDSLEWIPSGTSSDHNPVPEPSDMLDWETDVQDMIGAARNARDEAAIALQFDAGLRGFEFKDITVGDITDSKYGLKVSVDGKQGPRTVSLILSVPYVNRWLSDHPAPSDPNAPLWSKLSEPESVSYKYITEMFSGPAERAGVSKEVTLTNFRKSSASYRASRGMNQATLEDRHGWERGSEATSRYITVFSEDAERELARIHGAEIDESDEPDPTAPITCPRCNTETPRERDLCVHCNQALEPDAARKADELDDILAESLAEADGDKADQILGLRDSLKESPKLRSEAIDELTGLLESEH